MCIQNVFGPKSLRTRICFLTSSLVLLIFVAAQSVAWAQELVKPVKIIVPVQTGTGADLTGRYYAEKLTQALGQAFVVENRVGANGLIGMSAGAKAAPDGYTLVQGALGQNILNQYLFSSLPYDPEKDFDPIILASKIPFIISATPTFAVNSITELIAAAKAKPGTINVTITSATARILYEHFKKASGIDLYPVFYQGPSAAIPDVMAGRVSVLIETVPATRPLVITGKLKALGITTQTTSDLLPGVKSVAEQGVAGFNEVVGWTALFAPRGSPKAIINLVHSEMDKIMKQEVTKKRLFDLGAEVGYGTTQDLEAFLTAERQRWGQIIRSANIKVD